MDVIRDLKRINGHLASVAYPILEAAGELADTRLKTAAEPTTGQPAPSTRRLAGPRPPGPLMIFALLGARLEARAPARAQPLMRAPVGSNGQRSDTLARSRVPARSTSNLPPSSQAASIAAPSSRRT